MKNFRRDFERFCLRNRNKGIPNLMLYIVLGSGVVFLLSMFNGGSILYEWLRFDKAAILRGQVWRLFTYVLTYTPGSNQFMVIIGLYFFYHLSRTVELIMGTFRFNLFYFTGVILMDLFAMIFCPIQDVMLGEYLVPPELFTAVVYSDMAWYLHLSLLLFFAACSPDSEFLVFFIIPVKAWFLGVLYVVLTAVSIFNLTFPISFFPHNLFPLVALANFFLFTGKDALNLLPPALRPNIRRYRQPAPRRTGTIPFSGNREESKPRPAPYSHKCTVCGRTDVSNPELEFRYCSRCSGYHCYCSEHISNHTHIE